MGEEAFDVGVAGDLVVRGVAEGVAMG